MSSEIRTTTDLDQFHVLDGNRGVNQSHVKQLQNLLLENGNLTTEFPIVVDKDMNVIDGQHRLQALKHLGWGVAYRVEENATIDTVRAINQGNRNWNWRDIAYSYSSRGNKDYEWFLNFVDQYAMKFNPAVAIVMGNVGTETRRKRFTSGELTIEDKAKAHDIGFQTVQIERLVEISSNDFSYALITIMKSPAYDHERMVHKLRQMGETLPDKARQSDYMRRLEEIYNHGFAEENKTRLF